MYQILHIRQIPLVYIQCFLQCLITYKLKLHPKVNKNAICVSSVMDVYITLCLFTVLLSLCCDDQKGTNNCLAVYLRIRQLTCGSCAESSEHAGGSQTWQLLSSAAAAT